MTTTAPDATEAELDALVERYARYPGALAVDNWRFYRQQLEEIERAEHPDVTDGYGRTWRWFGRGRTYVHDDSLAYSIAWIPHLGLPAAAVADNPNYRLCGICRSAWPPEDQERYAQVQAARSACAVCRLRFEADEWVTAFAYERQADGLWTFAHFGCRERALQSDAETRAPYLPAQDAETDRTGDGT